MSAFITIAIIHLLGVASPGPDFAIVAKQSVTRSRRTGIFTALGVALGILVHVGYSLLGIGLLIARSIVLFNTIKLIGAIYLIYIGWHALTSKAIRTESSEEQKHVPDISPGKAWKTGFLVNVLNPKATLFMLALFTQVIDPSTPVFIQAFYGIYMAAATFAWFSLIASIFSLPLIRRHLEKAQTGIERVMGVVLIELGLKVALSTHK